MLADELLRFIRSYLKPITALSRQVAVCRGAYYGRRDYRQFAARSSKRPGRGYTYRILAVPPLFEMLRAIGEMPEADWRRTFNLGVGMILVIPRGEVNSALRTLNRTGEKPWIIGEVIQQRRGKGRVEYR